VIFGLVRMKGISLRPKLASILTTVLISSLLVSIPIPANAAACTSPTTATVGADTVVTFTAVESCDWTVPAGVTSARVLVVGGGASASAGISGSYWPGGGGGGEVKDQTSYSLTPGANISVVVGSGGAATAAASGATGNNGTASTFGLINANPGLTNTNSTASSAGAKGGVSGSGKAGGIGSGLGSGGGGGASAVGSVYNGGAGIDSDISGATVGYGGGGAGGNGSSGTASDGGAVGWYTGAAVSITGNGIANTGGGGARSKATLFGGAGGSGVVIVRFATPVTCSPTTSSAGADTVLTFTATGTCAWTPPANVTTFELLVVGAGGGGASNLGGGGGGGRVISESNVTISQPATITVGTGGDGGVGNGGSNNTNHGKTGGRSAVVSGSVNVVSLGGSGGKGRTPATNLNPDGTDISSGWTGGGGAYPDTAAQAVPVAGAGGSSVIGGAGSGNGGGGGGGAGGPGVARGDGSTPSSAASSGGIGISNSITGTATYYGGGGGASWYGGSAGWTGAGGLGGGGQGANGNTSSAGVNGTANSGGGGGAGYVTTGGDGGSGIVIIRYGVPVGFSAVIFNANNGIGAETAYISTANGGTLPSSTSITRPGFVFTGWNAAANGSGTPYALGGAITVSANTTLYAQWSRITSPSCAAGVGKGGIQSGTVASTKAGNGCVGISYFASGVNTTVTFNYTGADQSWTVPSGVTSATFYLFGAGGGGNTRTSGGNGGYATGGYSVTAGQVYTIIVGEGGGGLASALVAGLTGKYTKLTYGGGGRGGSTAGDTYIGTFASGGGRSAIRAQGASTDLATAGGGGGGGYGICGNGGGGLIGEGARGGTQTAGGASAAVSLSGVAGNGSAYLGGTSNNEGGGGGGGYFGGGDGGDNAGGGGGSSYIALLRNGVTTSGGSCSGELAETAGIGNIVTYNANGATSGTAPYEAIVPVGKALTASANTGILARTNYTFSGWNTAADGSGTTYAVASTTFIPTGNVTLYAQWNSTITYNGNGQTSVSSTVPAATTAKGSSNTTLANAGTMARSNFSFAGWNTQADGLGTNYASGLTTYSSTGNTTLYAKWTATITYDPNGASGSPATSSSNSAPRTSDQIVNTLSAIALSNLPTVGTMVRPGFTFGGWNTAALGTGTNYSPNTPQPYMRLVASDFNNTTKAWTDSSGNNRHIAGTATTSTTGNIRGTPTLVDTTGTTLVPANGSTAIFKAVKGGTTDGIVLGNEALAKYTLCHVARYAGNTQDRIFAGITGNWLSGYWNGAPGVAYHEGWITATPVTNDKNWRVICDIGGGPSGLRSNGVDKTTAANNATGLPANITINLQGGRTTASGVSDWEVAEVVIYDGILNQYQIETLENSLKTTYGISGYTSPTTPASAGSYTPTGNAMLYARWLPNAYNLTFDTSTVSSGLMPDQWFSAGTTFTLPTNTFTRTGYTFKNWNTAANGSGTTYTNSQSVSLFAGLTLYPQWDLIAPGVPTVLTDSGNTEVTVTPTPAAASGTTVGPTTSMLVTAYPDGGNSFTPSTISRRALASNVATLTTAAAHNLKVGERVIIAAVAAAFNGTYTVTSVPSSTTFTYATSGQADVVSVTSTGSATLSRTCSVVSPATSCVITGLTNGTTYQFAATATNATGTSASSTKVSGLPTGVAVTYNTSSNSGIIGTSGSTTTSSATFNKGSSLTLPVASRTGYEFSGWFSAATSGTLVGGPGGNYSPSLTASVTTRSLTSNVVTLTTSSPHGFVVGMTVSVININSTFNGSYTITSVPTTTTFTYAKTATDVTSASVTPSGRATVTALTVYAQFVGLTYTITYNGNGNTGGVVPPRGSVQVGGSAYVIDGATTPPTKTGYTFDGWYTTSTGSGGTSFAVGASYSSAANLNLFAKWTANTNAISYNANTGTGDVPTSGSYISGAVNAYTVLAKPAGLTKTGSDFIGWNTVANGSGISYSAGAFLTTLTDTILYAQWGVSTYSYSYQLNGGTSAQPASGTAVYNTVITLPIAPTRNGFTFAGWNDGSPIALSTTSVTLTSNKILVAQWTAQSFSITYDGNTSTSGSVSAGAYVAGGVPYAIAANSFTKTGYNFIGWYTTANGTGGAAYAVGAGYSTTANLVLYAQWAPASYTITYNANGATSGTVPSAGTLTTGTTFSASTNSGTLVKTGYEFAGWNTSAAGTGTPIAVSGVVTTTSNLILYAKWTIISPTITFNDGAATAALSVFPANTSAQYGSLYTLPAVDSATVISTVNYIFTGWSDGSATYNSGQSYRMGTSNVIFTAQWVALFDVTYIYGNGVTADTKDPECVTSLLCTNNQPITTTAAPSRAGYTFTHWIDQSGTTVAGNAAYTVSDGHYVLRAVWAAVPRTLSFTANSGEGSQSSLTNNYIGELVALPASTYTRTGYTFSGWLNGGVTYPAGGTFIVGDADAALSAVWVANSNTIFYNGNGATGGTAPDNGAQATGAAYTVASNRSGNDALAKTGFTFAGWNTNASGTGTDYAEGATGLATTSNVTLYAKWTGVSSAVTYVTGDGASTAPTQSNTMYGSIFALPSAPTRTGFNFIGWETGSDANATVYAPASNYTMGATAVTFTAKWSGLSYVVVYQLNGGEGTAPTQADVTHGLGFTTAAAPIRTGFTFTGWSDGATLINASTSVTNVTTNRTLTAQWTIAAPGIPGTPTAAPGNGSATITIVVPTTGGTPSSYTVTASPGGATCTVTAPATSCSIAPLDNGTAYTFTSTARNTAGNSTSASTASAAVTPAGVPLSPSSITGAGTGGSTTIEWIVPTSDGGSPITDYVIEYRVASSGTWTTFSDGTSTATSATITGLSAGNAYEFRVSAKNLIGNSLPSFSSPVIETLATAPSISSVTGASEKVTVAWNAPTHLGSGTLTDYEVTAYDAAGNVAGSCNPASGQRTCEITGLDNGASYTFKVAAITSVGSSAQSSASAVVVPAGVPSAPANVVAVTSGSNMTVTFEAPADNGGSAITSYVVTSSPAGATCTVGANATTYTCTGLTAGTNYTYTVKAVNSKGESSASLASTSTTAVAAPSAPLNVSAVITAGTTTLSATVSFDPPANENGSPVTSYTVTASPGGATCTVTAPTTYCDIPVLPDRVYTFSVKATNTVGTSAASSASLETKATNGIAPTLVVDPIPAPTGDLVENKVLSSNVGVNSFNSTPNSVVTYQWKRCTDPLDAATCTSISGATSATYTLGSGDVDNYIRVEVTATNSIGDITKLSEATAVIVAAVTAPSTPSTPSTPVPPVVDPTPVAPTCDAACQSIRDAAATKAAADAAAKSASDKAAADAAAKLKADADARTASTNASAAAKAAADAARTAVERAGAAAAAKAAADAAAAAAAAQAKAAADAQAAANRAAAAAQAALKNSAASAAAKAAATASANKAAADATAAVKAAATAAQNATKAKTAEANANKQVDIAINSLSSKTASAKATAEANAIAAAAKAAANEAAAAAAAKAEAAKATASAAQKAAADAAARISTEQKEAATAAAAAKAAADAAAKASAEKIVATNAAKVATENLVKVLNEKATLAEEAAKTTDSAVREEIAKKIEEIETKLEEVEAAAEEAVDAAEEATTEFEEAQEAATEAQDVAIEQAQEAVQIKTEAATKTAAATKAVANASVAAKVATAAKAAAAKVPSKAVIKKPATSTTKNSAKATVTGLKPGQKVKVTVNVRPKP
jgi:uncharacterized repeat protein (TIGR02543 family)